MEQNLYLVISEGFRTFFLLIVPIFSAILAGSILASLLQGFLGIRDQAFSFCIRLLSFIAVSGVLLASFYETLRNFFLTALS